MKKFLVCLLAAALLTLPTVTASAASTDQTVQILGGSLTSTQSPINFGNVVLDLSQNQKTNGSSTVAVSDARGTGAGWGINLKATDFEQTLNDPSAPSTSTIKVAIPVSNVKVSTANGTVVSGQAIDASYGPKPTGDKILSNIDQTAINASPGFGMGDYRFAESFELSIPKVVNVKSVIGTGSKYVNGGTVGILAGTYTSTFTFTLVTGV
jgi:hypothetical protein